MTDRELMQQALEALEMLSQQPIEMALDYADNAIDVLRERLAQPEQPDLKEQELSDGLSWLKKDSNYFSQPKRKPLTDEEIWGVYMKTPVDINCHVSDLHKFARAIEAAHGIKGGV